MISENKLLLSHISDLIMSVKKGRKYAFTSFLNDEQLSLALSLAKSEKVFFSSFGGYEFAERCIVGFGCDDEPSEYSFPLATLTFDLKGRDDITHRHVLGSLMSLGLKRECIGDIIFSDGKCYFFSDSKMSDFICMNFLSVSSLHVDVRQTDEIIKYERSFEEFVCIVASMRLDCVVSELCNKSRTQASEYIEGGLVFVNGSQCLKKDKAVTINDVISVRRMGKFCIADNDGYTKKNRIKLKILKYI